MKKEFLDFLYDKRAILQAKIDEMVKIQNEPVSVCCNSMPTSIYNKPLEEVRLHIQSVNFIISEYLLIHKN